MTCQNCARHASEALSKVPGVERVRLQLEPGSAEVFWKPGYQSVEFLPLKKALEEVGFECSANASPKVQGETKSSQKLFSGWGFNLLVGLPVFILMMIAEWGFESATSTTYRTIAFLSATVVLAIAGSRFYRGAWQQFKKGRSNMDTLVSLGATSAYLFSVWGWATDRLVHLYFMETVGILTLISLGHWMEAKISAKASSTLKSLMELAPQRARRRDERGGFEEVNISELRVGDWVEIRPGDQVPTDGVIVEGTSALDESMLTGESMPVEKVVGNPIYGATQNGQGRLVVRVTGLGEETALAKIIQVVERAQNSRANIQRLGDQVSSVFVPAVVMLALAALFGWLLWPAGMQNITELMRPFLWTNHMAESVLATAVIHSVAVLIVACPCAMGLATPAAIMAGTNAAASRGILIRDGQALEKSGHITTLVFDKTGTLTQGKPEVASIKIFDDQMEQNAFNRMIASLASRSNHPLSRAIARSKPDGQADSFKWESWTEKAGFGIQARLSKGMNSIDGSEIRLGSLSWLKDRGVEFVSTEEFQNHWMEQGATVVGIAADQQLLGLIALKDVLKRNALEVLQRIQGSGWGVHMITGDHKQTATAIARELALDARSIHAEVKPDQKAAIIQNMQAKGDRVAYIGDGINDAPALEQADLGIAVTRASDIAREASDMILLKADIDAIPEALNMARATLRTIKQNLFWAFFYNAAAIPLAMFGFMSPLLCAAAMGFSDVLVIGNSLRLRLIKKS